MKKVFRKSAMIALLLVAIILLCSCKSNDPATSPGDPSSDPAPEPTSSESVLADFEAGEAESHIALLPLPLEAQNDEETEDIATQYYERTTNDDGEPVYKVLKADNEQYLFLPMNNTVLYTGDYDSAYVERYTVKYTENGEPKSLVQYQLYVPAVAALA